MIACFQRESEKIIAFKGSSLALSASLCSAALPKGEPLAVPANFILLPEPLPFGAVDLRSTDRAENPPKAEKRDCRTAFVQQSLGAKCFGIPSACALGIISGKITVIRARAGRLRAARPCIFTKNRVSPAVRSQYRSTPSLVTRAYTSGAFSGFSAPYTRPLRYSAAAASNLSAAP